MNMQDKKMDALDASNKEQKEIRTVNSKRRNVLTTSFQAFVDQLSNRPRNYSNGDPEDLHNVHSNCKRSGVTQKEQEKRSIALHGRFVKFMEKIGWFFLANSPILFALWVIWHKSEYAPQSFENMKRLCVEYLRNNPHLNNEFAIGLIENEGKSWKSFCLKWATASIFMLDKKRKKAPKRKRVKCFPFEDFKKIEQYLKDHPEFKYSKDLLELLNVIKVLGYRSCELSTFLMDYVEDSQDSAGGWYLTGVISAKKRDAKDKDFTRFANVTDIAEVDLEFLLNYSEKVQKLASEGSFKTHIDGCRRLLTKVCKELGLPNYSFYSMRYQVINNLLSIMSAMEVSILVGHKELKSTFRYYVKNSAWDKEKIPPIRVVDKS